MRIYKPREEILEPQTKSLPSEYEKPPRSRRRSIRIEENSEESRDNNESFSKLEELTSVKVVSKDEPMIEDPARKDPKPMRESLKSRAAMFEQNTERISPPSNLIPKNRTVRYWKLKSVSNQFACMKYSGQLYDLAGNTSGLPTIIQ